MRFATVMSALALAGLLLAPLAGMSPARAEASVLRVARPLDLAALPLVVMEREHLIERTAEAMGLGEVTVAWQSPPATGPLEALAAGQIDAALADPVAFLAAADSRRGSAAELRAIAAVAQRPYVLVTSKPAIHTVRDFGAADRIAVPALKLSGPAVMLEMAAAQEWGAEHYDKLDRLAVARADAAAADALVAGAADIDAHVSRSPYADAELADPKVHRVMDSFDIDGPHSAALLVTSQRLSAGNPELCKAVLSALQSADDLIRKTPGEAAEIYAAATHDRDIPLEDLSDMIGDPDLAYRAAPAGIMRLAEFLARIGRLKSRPAAWQELFVPQSRDLAGN